MTYKITSPMMGTFYKTPAQSEKPIVEIGQKVKAGDSVCIIESMKIFTELRAEKTGTVVKIFVEDEDMIMKGQEIMEIELEEDLASNIVSDVLF